MMKWRVKDLTNSTKESKGRWINFTDNELRMIAYGLSQIHGDPVIDEMLKEINPIVFPISKGNMG